MKGGTNDLIERLKKGDSSMLANLLAQTHPEIDPTKLMQGGPGPTELPPGQQSPMGFNAPGVYAQAPKGPDVLGALAGAQSGMPAPRVQAPAPSHFSFGAAQLAKQPNPLPEGPSLSHLILGGR